MARFSITVFPESSSVKMKYSKALNFQCRPNDTIAELKCAIFNEVTSSFIKAEHQWNRDLIHLLRYKGAIITNDKAKLSDYEIGPGAELQIRYEPTCVTSEPKYVYSIMDEHDWHLGLFTSLQKAKDTVKEVRPGIKGDVLINRIPLDTISYFDEHMDCVEKA